MKSFVSALILVVSISFVYGLTVDTFTENSGFASTNFFCACTTDNSTCYINSASLGGRRSQILIPLPNPNGITWEDGCNGEPDYSVYCDSGLSVQTGCPVTGCVGQYGTGGQLSFSSPPASFADLYLIWDGGCATTINQINYNGLGGVDLTDRGISDSFNIQIGKVDLSATLAIYIWSDANRGSYAAFDPSALGKQANIGGSYARATLSFVQNFVTIPGLSGGADFKNVGAIAVEVIGVDSLDLIIALIETAGALELRKSASITTDAAPIGVAGTGDVITFNLTLAYNGLGSAVQTVYLWDDPNENYKLSPANYFPYYSLVPGSLVVSSYDIDPTSGAYTAANYSSTEINGPNVQANLNRLVVFLGNVSEYTAYNVLFSVSIPASLPCCLPTCRTTCNITTGGESCYCIANTAYFCEESDGVNLNITDASGNKPNFNSAFVDANCGYSTVPTNTAVGSTQSTIPQITVTPVYAPSSPYTVFTTPAPPASVQPGGNVCGYFIVGNNGTRDTAAVVTFSYSASLLTPTTTGSSAGFTCSGSTCVSGLIQYPAGSAVTYNLCFTANQLSTCTQTQSQFSVAIAPNGCNSTTIVGPISNGANGSAATGNVPVGSCVDINAADNGAVSSPTTIAGSAVLAVSSNFTSSTIAPSGTTILTICYSNTGNVPATNSIISISLPSGVSASGSGWTVSGTSATYNAGTIAAGTVCAPVNALTITYTASVLNCDNSNLNFPVNLNSDCGNATASSTVLPTGNTAISLTKTAAATSVAVGSVISYSLVYTNNGSRQFDTVTLNDTVPANTVYSGNNGWVCSPNNNAGSVCTVTVSANSGPVPFQVTVSANATCDITSVTNTANAQGYCAGPPVSFQTNIVTSTVSVAVTGNPDFYVTKVATDGNGNAITGVQAGGQVTYVISYGNRGQRVSSAVITEGAVGAPFSFVGPASWSSADASGQRTLNVANVYPGQTGNVTFVVSSTNTLANCNNVTVPNTVSIAAVAPCVETNLADNTATASATVSASVDLYIYFTNITSSYRIPDSATANLEFCYGNNGNSGTTNAVMTVTLPAGITIASSGNTGFVASGSTVTYAIGSIAANAPATCRTLIVNLPTTLNCTDQSYGQVATITSDCSETNTTNNQTPYSFAVNAIFDLYITLSQPANATITQVSPQVTYCITYGNNGAKTVTPVIITEFLPINTTFVASASDSRWVLSTTGIYTLNLGSVDANFASSTCIAFTVSANLPLSSFQTSITNYVTISNNGICGSEDLSNNNATVTTRIVGNPDLFVLKTNNNSQFFGTGAFTSPVGGFSRPTNYQGNVVQYVISYGNNGDADAINATITETVPLSTVFDKDNSNQNWTCEDGAPEFTTCTANVGRVPIPLNRAQNFVYGNLTFAVRASTYSPATYTPAIRCPTGPTTNYVNIAVLAPQVDLNQANNQANVTTPFLGLPDLYITKTVANPTLLRVSGDVITYTIEYGNQGVKEAINTIITDTIPEFTIFNAGASSSGIVCSSGGVAGSNCTFSAGNIASGVTGFLTLSVTLQPGFPASALSTTNYVEISNACEGGNETLTFNNYANVTVNITGYYDLVLQKHGYCESILFTMNYENVGTIGARDVYLKTYIPQDTSFDANNSAAGWICNANTPGAECRYPVTGVNPRDAGVLDYIAPGASGSVNFAVSPYSSSMSSTFTLDSSIDDNFTGDNLDPTPDNNRASTTVGFSGCAACDSCCPAVDQCCPDYTDVAFNFGGVLDGLNTCSS